MYDWRNNQNNVPWLNWYISAQLWTIITENHSSSPHVPLIEGEQSENNKRMYFRQSEFIPGLNVLVKWAWSAAEDDKLLLAFTSSDFHLWKDPKCETAARSDQMEQP